MTSQKTPAPFHLKTQNEKRIQIHSEKVGSQKICIIQPVASKTKSHCLIWSGTTDFSFRLEHT